jgi:hypothetical protein
MKVRATKRGLFGHIREIGDEFEVPEGTKGSWFEPVDDEAEHGEDAAPRRGRPPRQ